MPAAGAAAAREWWWWWWWLLLSWIPGLHDLAQFRGRVAEAAAGRGSGWWKELSGWVHIHGVVVWGHMCGTMMMERRRAVTEAAVVDAVVMMLGEDAAGGWRAGIVA